MTISIDWHVVELEPGVWIAEWNGDPGRTLRYEYAQRFATAAIAENALRIARQHRPFANARIAPSDPPREG